MSALLDVDAPRGTAGAGEGEGIGGRPRLLIVEPRQLFARTLVLVARELRVAEIEHAASYPVGDARLAETHWDGLLLGLQEGRDGLEGLSTAEAVRTGRLGARSDLPIALMADACTPSQVLAFRALAIDRVILRPFKIRTVIDAMQALCRAPTFGP